MGGGCRSSSPMDFILPPIKIIPTSQVKGAHCNTDSLHMMHIMRVSSCHLTFQKKRKKSKESQL